jgi:hypothetical protein
MALRLLVNMASGATIGEQAASGKAWADKTATGMFFVISG